MKKEQKKNLIGTSDNLCKHIQIISILKANTFAGSEVADSNHTDMTLHCLCLYFCPNTMKVQKTDHFE